jgi:hypothetical protein
MGRGASSIASRRVSSDGAGRWPWWKIWLIGTAILVVDIVVSALLLNAGYFVAPALFACLCGVALGSVVLIFSSFAGMGVQVTGLCAACVIGVGAGIVAPDEVVLFGRTARDVVVADAHATGASFLHFRDARVLVDRSVSVPVWASSGRGVQSHHIVYDPWAAPVVDAGWTPEQPIATFAVIGDPQFGHRRSEWSQPWRAGIQLNGTHASERNDAVYRIARRGGVTTVANPVFIRWAADPEGEAAAARGRLANGFVIAFAAWSLLLVIGYAWGAAIRRRGAGARGRYRY